MKIVREREREIPQWRFWGENRRRESTAEDGPWRWRWRKGSVWKLMNCEKLRWNLNWKLKLKKEREIVWVMRVWKFVKSYETYKRTCFVFVVNLVTQFKYIRWNLNDSLFLFFYYYYCLLLPLMHDDSRVVR
jgi:hypothetical protein